MVINHICAQGLSLHWKTLDQSAVCHSVFCLFVFCSFVRSFVCLFVRLSVSLSFYSFVPSFARSIDRSIDRLFLVFRQVLCPGCFARPFSPIVHSKMVSFCLVSSRIPKNVFHSNPRLFQDDIPSPKFVLLPAFYPLITVVTKRPMMAYLLRIFSCQNKLIIERLSMTLTADGKRQR